MTAADGVAERSADRSADLGCCMSCRGATEVKVQASPPRTPAGRKPDSGWTFSKSTRPAFNDNLVLYVSRRLTDRDRAILCLLADHRVLTSDQLADALFGLPTTARHRLTQLHQLRVVQRFSPFVSKGSAPYHYVLDRLGAEVVAAERGVEAKKLWRQDRSLVLARSRTLERVVSINGFFTALMGEARRRPECHLLEWWSAARCEEWCGDLVKPDAYGAWEEDGTVVGFFVWIDRGEPLDVIAKVGEGFAHLADALQHHLPALFVCKDTLRRTAVCRTVCAQRVLGFAATADDAHRASRRVWLSPDLEAHRLGDLLEVRTPGVRPFDRAHGKWPDWHYQQSAPWTAMASGLVDMTPVVSSPSLR